VPRRGAAIFFALQHKLSPGQVKKDEDIHFPGLPDRFFWYTKF
jgi:hypothetical protein